MDRDICNLFTCFIPNVQIMLFVVQQTTIMDGFSKNYENCISFHELAHLLHMYVHICRQNLLYLRLYG